VSVQVSGARIARRAFQVTGIGLLVLAIFLSSGTALFLQHAVTADATVVALIEKTDADDGTIAYYPQFTFSTPAGSSFTIVARNGSKPAEFKRGQKVRVLYERTNPYNAKIDTFLQLWLLPLIFGSIGIFFLAVDWLISCFQPERPAPQA
jgi:hypothetical protein